MIRNYITIGNFFGIQFLIEFNFINALIPLSPISFEIIKYINTYVVQSTQKLTNDNNI